MTWSLGETKALAIKAARGAGLAWGLAEEAGFAVHWLQNYGAPGVRALADYLRWRAAPDCATRPVWLTPSQPHAAVVYCPVELGAALADAGNDAPVYLGHVRQPLMLVPFIAASNTAAARRLTWRDAEILIFRQGFSASAQPRLLLAEQAECRLADSDESRPASPRMPRVPETEASYIALLEKFAARTYAPATEQSRLMGAGAGLDDSE